MRKKLKIEEEVKVNKTLNIVTLTNYAWLGWEKPPTEKISQSNHHPSNVMCL